VPGEEITLRAADFGLSLDALLTAALSTRACSARLLRSAPGDESAGIVVRIGESAGEPEYEAGRCPVCGAPGLRPVALVRGMNIGRCATCRCGVVISCAENNAEAEYCEDYSDRYERELLAGKAADCWKLLVERTGGLRGVGSLLDIGCGAGTFLNLARDAGLRTAGLDVSVRAAVAVAEAGHEAYCASATGAPFPPGARFDVAVMWDLLEHLRVPTAALRNARRALAPGGRLFVATPKMDSVFDRAGVALHRATFGRVDQLARMCWSHDHLTRFHPRGIAEVLRSAGFDEVRITPIQLLSLRPEKYVGGEILPTWTGSARLDGAISRTGVRLARVLRLTNKILIEARVNPA